MLNPPVEILPLEISASAGETITVETFGGSGHEQNAHSRNSACSRIRLPRWYSRAWLLVQIRQRLSPVVLTTMVFTSS
jgi:hypothetical protein